MGCRASTTIAIIDELCTSTFYIEMHDVSRLDLGEYCLSKSIKDFSLIRCLSRDAKSGVVILSINHQHERLFHVIAIKWWWMDV